MEQQADIIRRRGCTSQAYFTRHFFARAWALIVFPFIVYLVIFWIHFKILIYSGPGDTFMSPAFQETSKGNELLLNAQGESSMPAGRLMLGDGGGKLMLLWVCDDRIEVLGYRHDQAQGYQEFLALSPRSIPAPVRGRQD